EDDGVARPRRGSWHVRRFNAAPSDVANECRRPGAAAKDTVERELDSINGVVLSIHATDEPTRPLGHRVSPNTRRARVDAANTRRRRDVRREISTRQCDPRPLRVERAANPLRPHLHLRKRAVQRGAILRTDLTRRNLEL